MSLETIPTRRRAAFAMAVVAAAALCLSLATAAFPVRAAAGSGMGAYAESTGVDVVYATLSEALDAASDDDTVHVLAEGVALGEQGVAVEEKTVRIVGDAGTSAVTYVPGQKGLSLRSARLSLEDVTVRPADASLSQGLKPSENALFVVGDASELELAQDAVLQGGVAGLNGGAVRVAQGGSFVMADGSQIRRFAVSNAELLARDAADADVDEISSGGAVFVEKGGSFLLEGGTIADCSAYRGGAVYAAGSVRFAGGAVQGCTAFEGPAAYVAEQGLLEESGTEVSDCVAYGAQGDIYRAAEADEGPDSIAAVGAKDGAGSVPGLCTLVGVGVFDTLQAAVDAVPENGTGVIEMNYPTRTLQKQVKIDKGKDITITTATGVDSCAFTCWDKQVGGLALFKVSGKASLTFDGTRNGRDGADANGIVLQGDSVDSGKADDDPKGNRGIDVYEGTLTLKDVTVRNFSADFGSTAGIRATGVNAERATVRLEGTSMVKNCTMFGGGAIKENAGGVTVYGDTEFSDMPTSLFMGPESEISDCVGVTGGLAVSKYATATIQGTIKDCRTYDGVANRCAGGIWMSEYAKVTLEDATLTGNRAMTGTPNVTSCAGAIWVEGGQLAIHGATITGNTANCTNGQVVNPNGAGAIGMNSDLLTSNIEYVRLALSGKVVVKDNRIEDGRTQTNITLTKSGINFMHYVIIDGDLEPGSYVGITAQGSKNTARYAESEAFGISMINSSGGAATDKYMGAASYSGDAKMIENLNCLVNDRDTTLRGQASWTGWKSPGYSMALQAKKTMPDAPAAIIWARSYDLKVMKKVDDASGSVAGPFEFSVQVAAAGYAGQVYDADGTPTGQMVQAHKVEESFRLDPGQYVLFEHVTSIGSGKGEINAITVKEKNSIAGTTSDPTAPFVCDVSAKTDKGVSFGSVDAAADGTAQWRGNVETMTDSILPATVVFMNKLRMGSFAVQKTVVGDYADITGSFTFELTLHVPSFMDADAEYAARVVSSEGGDTGVVHAFKSDMPGVFSLKAGEQLVFDGLAVGTTYDLVERPAPVYQASAEVKTLDSDGNAVVSAIAEGDKGAGLSFSYGDAQPGIAAAKVAYGADNTVSVTNRVPSAPPTGVAGHSDGMPLLLVVGGVAVSALLVFASIGVRRVRMRM